jgi:hypothetical protein
MGIVYGVMGIGSFSMFVIHFIRCDDFQAIMAEHEESGTSFEITALSVVCKVKPTVMSERMFWHCPGVGSDVSVSVFHVLNVERIECENCCSS